MTSVLITGANRGIGAGLLEAYRDDENDAFGTHRASPGGRLLQLDVQNPQSHADLAKTWGDRPLDLLICNAGVYLDKGERLETGFPAQQWEDTFATNVTGVFLTIQSLLPALRRASSPRIAIISSQMASQTNAPGGSYIYRASKAAALNLGRNLAADLRSDGIAVGIYHPGWVQTDMGGDAAAITVDEAVRGLRQEFDRLSLQTTGCFRTWDGRDHPL